MTPHFPDGCLPIPTEKPTQLFGRWPGGADQSCCDLLTAGPLTRGLYRLEEGIEGSVNRHGPGNSGLPFTRFDHAVIRLNANQSRHNICIP